MRRAQRTLAFGALLVASTAVLIASANVQWDQTNARLLRVLGADPRRDRLAAADDELPLCVQRYFAFTLGEKRRAIERVTLVQSGTMRGDAMSPWRPFRAIETVSARAPGFLWNATMSIAPGLAIRVRDAYVGHAGISEGSLCAIVPLGGPKPGPAVNSASLLRYLAESAWVPTALLPTSGVSWASIDETHARATLTDGAATVSMDVTFDADGSIAQIAALRERAVGSTVVLTPWIGKYSAYTNIEGMMIPLVAEASWAPADGTFATWRGHIDAASYTFD